MAEASTRHASWLELFLDLVVVAAVVQPAHRLHGDPGLADIATFAALYLARADRAPRDGPHWPQGLTTYGNADVRSRSLIEGPRAPEVAVPRARENITSGAKSASVRPLMPANPNVAGVPTS